MSSKAVIIFEKRLQFLNKSIKIEFTLNNLKIRILEKQSIVKPVKNGHSQKDPKLVSKTNNRLMQVKSIAECSKGSILQYCRSSLSYHLSLRSLICLFLSGRLRHGLRYCNHFDEEERGGFS